jgi:hypothetical protein
MANQEKMDEEIIGIADNDNDNNNNSSKQSVGIDGDGGIKCQVCGISAQIRHFDGIVCRPCCAFFRYGLSIAIFCDKKFFFQAMRCAEQSVQVSVCTQKIHK